MVCSNYCPLTSPIKVDFHITVHAPPQLLPHQRRQRVTGPAALAVTILEESRLLRNQTNLTNQRKKRDQEGKSQKRTRVKLLSLRWKPHSHPLGHLCHWGDPRSGSWSDQGPLHRALAGWSKRTISHSCPPPSALVYPPFLSSPIATFILYYCKMDHPGYLSLPLHVRVLVRSDHCLTLSITPQHTGTCDFWMLIESHSQTSRRHGNGTIALRYLTVAHAATYVHVGMLFAQNLLSSHSCKWYTSVEWGLTLEQPHSHADLNSLGMRQSLELWWYYCTEGIQCWSIFFNVWPIIFVL